MRFKTWAGGISLACAALLSACGGGGGGSTAQVRLLNASISYPALDMVVGTSATTVSSNIAYAAVGDYASIKTDDAGTEIQNSAVGSTLVSTTPSLTAGDKYTMIAYGTVGAVRTTLLQESQTNPDAGKSKLLVLNLAPDAGALDVYESATTETTLDNAATVVSGLAAGSGSGYASLKSGTFRLVLTAAGDKSDVRLVIPSITLPDAGVSTLVLTGSRGGVLVNGMQMIQQGAVTNYANTTSRVRLVTGLSGGAVVTASLGGTAVATSTVSPAIGAYTQVSAGTPAFSLSVNGAPVSVSPPSLTAGDDYTLLLSGTAAAPAINVIADDNKLPSLATTAKIHLVNGMDNSTASLTLNVDYAAKALNVLPGQSSTPTQISASTTSLVTVNSAATSTALFSQSNTTFLANSVYTVFMLGDSTAPSGSLRRER